MRVVCLSDTHMRHPRVVLPEGDVLVHAGDFTRSGARDEVIAFLRWFGDRPCRARILVAGNHDLFCEREPDEMRRLARAHGVTYLLDEETVVDGLRIWGSPMTPRFRNMAYNRERGAEIRRHWSLIPAATDLLVTHGPPYGLGDRIVVGLRVGCRDLLDRVLEVAPRYHVFGHIHEAYGEYRRPGCPTRFLNVATRKFLPIGELHAPVVLDTDAVAATPAECYEPAHEA